MSATIKQTPTDNQLKQALENLLPDVIYCSGYGLQWYSVHESDYTERLVYNTELLYLCHIVEQALTLEQMDAYEDYFADECITSWLASWQERVIGLCKVKGIEYANL